MPFDPILHYEMTTRQRLHMKVLMQALAICAILQALHPQNLTIAQISRLAAKYRPQWFPSGTRFAVRARLNELLAAGSVVEVAPRRFQSASPPDAVRETPLATLLYHLSIADQALAALDSTAAAVTQSSAAPPTNGVGSD